ncbi:phosphoenolpyruvate-dependent sugar PTS family porter, EIIA 2 [delta proteobacterium NaphS2]|nr:phosphoenolpyruvate-dependent sugar PTS family porter, EIIA 2 [delta proteobacterium NaphS2]
MIFLVYDMKLSEILAIENIIPELKAKDKQSVLGELAEVITSYDTNIDKDALVKVLIEREHLGSTGIGDGVAIPHGKLSSVKMPIVSFGRSKKGLDFDSMDGQPAFLFFLLLAPENSSGVHLQVLTKIARILKSSTFRKALMQVQSREEIYQTIIQTDGNA